MVRLEEFIKKQIEIRDALDKQKLTDFQRDLKYAGIDKKIQIFGFVKNVKEGDDGYYLSLNCCMHYRRCYCKTGMKFAYSRNLIQDNNHWSKVNINFKLPKYISNEEIKEMNVGDTISIIGKAELINYPNPCYGEGGYKFLQNDFIIVEVSSIKNFKEVTKCNYLQSFTFHDHYKKLR